MTKLGTGNRLKSSATAVRWLGRPLTRVNYSAGKLLTADDFRTEQNYHLAKHRRHNLLCHGVGVVQGLEVSVTETQRQWKVVVHPGFALDSAGNEILLSAEVQLPLGQSSSPIEVAIVYREVLTEMVPVLGEPGATDSSSTVPSRVEEGAEVLLKPKARPVESACLSPEGYPAPGLSLARIVRRGHRWHVDRKFMPAQAR